ncbi:adenylate isopentenyltransferase 5, chloroplastic-like [Solanum verrucosum]|uniref:adenylate isopentenyltransferase 5, chloroplastic-like n=1 Tax=Solanum verrucosum TaxID=315347 RepID=UPI0020D1229C|nr:adenylate isopentenyltransferase 5, chloroplastic-like [Solanum verrucosum]
MNTFINNNKFNKKKVVFIMGATGMGKSRLSVDLATHFRAEIINSDKMQVYKGLEMAKKRSHTLRNKLYGTISIAYIENILKTQCVPIMVGGPNSHIEKLVEDPVFMFKYKYDTCVIWIDVEQSVLNRRVDMRVDDLLITPKESDGPLVFPKWTDI